MAQNVTVAGASYSDVPSVALPKTGGGTSSFFDVSDTTLTTGYAPNGYYFYDNSGTKTQGSLTVNPTPTGALGTSNFIVTIPKGVYSSATSYSLMKVTGSASATKGTVSNHSISVTPKFNPGTAGYIENTQKTGTAVTVSASELVSGSETKTANGTYDVTNLASLVVNVSGGGGTDRLQLLQTTALGALSTSSTSAADTGKTVSLAQSTGWQNYDLLLVDISVNTTTNGRHTSDVSSVFITGQSDIATKNSYAVAGNVWVTKLSSGGVTSSRYLTAKYGVYINAVSASNNTLTMTVYYRYNSTNTGTINGTYTARVYGIKLIDLIGG